MSIDNKYWCGGYKKWLKFSQEGLGLDKAQNCELAKKAKSEYGETLKWQIRKSENKKITGHTSLPNFVCCIWCGSGKEILAFGGQVRGVFAKTTDALVALVLYL